MKIYHVDAYSALPATCLWVNWYTEHQKPSSSKFELMHSNQHEGYRESEEGYTYYSHVNFLHPNYLLGYYL